MRELFRALSELENSLVDVHGISLNEAMVLCSIGDETIAASAIVKRTGMKASHTSKVIRLVEDKGFIRRELGTEDKRQMYFTLSDKGKICLNQLKENEIEVPKMLKPLFK